MLQRQGVPGGVQEEHLNRNAHHIRKPGADWAGAASGTARHQQTDPHLDWLSCRAKIIASLPVTCKRALCVYTMALHELTFFLLLKTWDSRSHDWVRLFHPSCLHFFLMGTAAIAAALCLQYLRCCVIFLLSISSLQKLHVPLEVAPVTACFGIYSILLSYQRAHFKSLACLYLQSGSIDVLSNGINSQ